MVGHALIEASGARPLPSSAPCACGGMAAAGVVRSRLGRGGPRGRHHASPIGELSKRRVLPVGRAAPGGPPPAGELTHATGIPEGDGGSTSVEVAASGMEPARRRCAREPPELRRAGLYERTCWAVTSRTKGAVDCRLVPPAGHRPRWTGCRARIRPGSAARARRLYRGTEASARRFRAGTPARSRPTGHPSRSPTRTAVAVRISRYVA